MSRAAVLALALVTGCVHIDRATLITSTATIACDWGYTHRGAVRGWMNGQHEENPIMGPTPSTTTVAAYFLTALALNTTAWALLPPRWRSIVPAAITAQQIRVLDGNSETVGGLCGF